MNLLPGLLTPSLPPTPQQGPVRVQLTLAPATRTELESQLRNLPLPQVLTAGTPNEDGTTPLRLSSGAVVQARISPPLTPGSQLTLTQLPSAVTGEVAGPSTITAQLTLALVKGAPTTAPVVLPTGMPNTAPQIATGMQAAQLTLANVQIVGGNVQMAVPNVLPAGPVLLTLPAGIVPNLAAQTELVLTPQGVGTQPVQVQGTQQIPVPSQPAILTGAALPKPVPVTVQAGQPLPAVPVTVVVAEEAAPAKGKMVVTLPASAPFTPPMTGTTPPPAPAPAQLEGLKILFFGANGEPQAPVLPPAGTPFAARVMTPPLPPQQVAQLGLPAGTVVQTAVLNTGQTVQIQLPPPVAGQSPIPLPAGTVLTMALDFTSTPVNNSPTVLRLQPATAQPQPNHSNPQPATTQTQVQTVQAPPPVGTIVSATVTGQTTGTPPQALLTLNSPPFAGQTFTLPTGQTLPVGTQVQLQFGQNLQATLLNFQLPPNFLRSQAATTLAHQWPTLTQVLHAMPTGMGAAQNIPTPMNFLATFLPYAKTLLEGQAQVPLSKDALMKAAALGLDFTPDLQQLTSLAARPETPEQWRGVLFPYIESPEADPRQGRFFWRQQKQEGREDAKPSTRFVLEFSLTQMGDLQLDGLVHYPEIWLKLRGHKPFVPEMQAEIGAVVKSTLEGLGLTGGISLEQASVFPINPLGELLREDPTSLNLSL